MSFTLAWPLVPWLFQVLVIGWFLLVGIYLATATEEVYRINQNCTCTDELSFVENKRLGKIVFEDSVLKALQ
jgi:hypothetical protein